MACFGCAFSNGAAVALMRPRSSCTLVSIKTTASLTTCIAAIISGRELVLSFARRFVEEAMVEGLVASEVQRAGLRGTVKAAKCRLTTR